MSTPVVTITRDGPEEVPFAIPLGPQETYAPQSIYAMFDGSGAAGDFLACCSIYSQDGSLIARCPAPTAVTAGDLAGVTFAPFLRQLSAGGGATVAHPFFYGQGDVFTNGTNSAYFTHFTDDASYYAYNAAQKRIEIYKPGFYRVTAGAQWGFSSHPAVVTTRLGMFIANSFIGVGTPTPSQGLVYADNMAIAVLDPSAGAPFWDVSEIDILNVTPGLSETRIAISGAASDGGNYDGALTVLVERLYDHVTDVF